MKNKKLETAKQYYHYIDANQGDKIGKIISDKFIDHDAKEAGKGFAELQELIVALHEGFSGISHEIEQIHPVDEDKVFVRWKMTGKHTGSFFNIPASGQNIILHGHDLFKISNGKIVEQWHIEQLLSLIKQISDG